jgi:hypothetical protein
LHTQDRREGEQVHAVTVTLLAVIKDRIESKNESVAQQPPKR